MTFQSIPLPSSSPPVSVAKPYFFEIDSLRALGCIAVTVYHAIWKFNEVAGSGLWLYRLLGERGDGFQGFLVFFIISGYVIPESLRGDRVEAVRRFAISRFFRLYPSSWLVLILGALVNYGTLCDTRFWWGLTMVPSLVGVDLVLGHFWALEVTMIFCGIVALLYLFFGRFRFRVLFPLYLLSLAFSFCKFARLVSIGIWPKLPLLLSLLFFGACLRKVVQVEEGKKPGTHSRFSLSSCLYLGGISGLMGSVPLYNMYLGFSLGDLGLFREFFFLFFWVIVFLFWVVLFSVKLSFLRGIGRASYSIYIWHMLMLQVIIMGIKSGTISMFSGWPFPVYVLVFLGLSLLVGGLSYRWIDQPLARIGRQIANRKRG